MRFFRQLASVLGVFTLTILTLLPASSVVAEERPNIILILTDDQGYQDLGCFGSESIKTPHLDRMAAEGVRLTSFYAQPVCGVSRAALMTGSYPIRIAEPGNIKRLHTVPHPKEVTMAEVLKQAGYATGLIGKWHLALNRKDLPTGVGPATMPNAQGFDYFYGTPKFNGFTVLVEDTDVRSPIFRNEEVVVEAVENWDDITADYTDEAIEWITANHEKPFFLYLAHNMPHIPLGASENFKEKSAGGFYGDTIEEIDWSCGKIFEKLKELGIDDNTLVIFASDNGPWVETTKGMQPDSETFIPRDHSGNADPLRGWKMSAWDGGSRVPFIARWPNKIPEGWESDAVLSTMDLLPTFASIAGANLPDVELDGVNAIDFLTQKSAKSPRDEYLYYSGCLLTGVRCGKWKLVLPRAESPEGLGWWGRMIEAIPETMLFNLDTDPGETTNVAQDHPNIVESLKDRIKRARTELGDIDQTGTGARFFDDGPRKLQSPLKKSKRTQPNIILLLADDLGYGDLSCFGSPAVKTPHLDRLANEGMKFTRFYAGSAVCSPTRASVLTGRYPLRFDITTHFNDVNRWLPESATTVAELLKGAGYNTAHVGKWHLGGLHVNNKGQRLTNQPGPKQHGFDFYQTQIEQQPLRGRMGRERTLFREGGTVLLRNDQRITKDDSYYSKHFTDANGDYAVELIEKFNEEGAPFFLNIWWLVPHKPYEPAPEPHWSNTKAEGISDDQHRFRSMVQHMDAKVGDILAKLDELGIAENTFILFTSDNGAAYEGFIHDLKGGKTDLHDGGIRVPMVVRWPALIPAGQTADAFGHTNDLLPTFCEAAGVQLPSQLPIDGLSLLSHLKGEEPPSDETRGTVFWQLDLYKSIQRHYRKPKPYATEIAMQGKWKLLTLNGKPVELFDIKADPNEKQNVMAEHPGIVSSMSAQVTEWLNAPRTKK